jgi:peptide chain release factor 3
VEEQTELVAVCRLRKIPIIVFINKMDREGKDADLMDEVEQKLGLTVTPLSFPIGWVMISKEYTTYGNKTLTYLVTTVKHRRNNRFSDVQNPELEKLSGKTCRHFT